MALTNVTGLEKVLKNLDRANVKIGQAVVRGLVKGGLVLQAAAQDIVPVNTGNLHDTAFIRNVGGKGFDADVIVGYTAAYAVYVHEDLTKAHGKEFNAKYAEEIAAAKGTKQGTANAGMHPRGENQQAKFLERPMREQRTTILKIIADEARSVR
jgi:hypothetical protein